MTTVSFTRNVRFSCGVSCLQNNLNSLGFPFSQRCDKSYSYSELYASSVALGSLLRTALMTRPDAGDWRGAATCSLFFFFFCKTRISTYFGDKPCITENVFFFFLFVLPSFFYQEGRFPAPFTSILALLLYIFSLPLWLTLVLAQKCWSAQCFSWNSLYCA